MSQDQSPAPSSDSTSPAAVIYRRRLAEEQAREAVEARREAILGNGRFFLFLPLIVACYFLFGVEGLAILWIVPVAVLFFALLVWHQRALRGLRAARRSVAFYQHGLARLDDRWTGLGPTGDRFLDPAHPYAADLDLFGPGSVFQLLCQARTSRGEQVLADWLRAPATPEVVAQRQQAVAELRERLDLREALAHLGGALPEGVDFEKVATWGAAPPVLTQSWERWVAVLLALLAVAAVLAWIQLETRLWPLYSVIILELLFTARMHQRVNAVISAIERRAGDLMLLGGLVALFEKQTFTAARLQELSAAFRPEGKAPSRHLFRLVMLLDWLNSRRNIYFAPLGALLLWTTQFAFAIESWRRRVGPSLEPWLAAIGEFEALLSLATLAWERPEDVVPHVSAEGPCFEGIELGHPLLPNAACVRNDARLDRQPQVLLVSGSNMSGKSTFLRTVGVNIVLALAGGTVRARRLTVSPLAIGATLRVQDSLMAGKSRFYAEITRIHQVVDLTRGPLPVLFLFDEIFHGTNSHERRLGAEGVIRSLVERGALGLLTTHDLALTEIANLLSQRVVNVHFDDQFEDGKLEFDYKMRPGVVTRSNALALMRAVGLDV